MKYLVVDDSRMARKMTINSLQKIISKDFEVIEASNGQEAIDLYKLHKPDICFMDLTMPILNGYDATKTIRSLYKDANVIVISADIQELAMKKAQEHGAIGFIKKPISQKSLQAMLEGLKLI